MCPPPSVDALWLHHQTFQITNFRAPVIHLTLSLHWKQVYACVFILKASYTVTVIVLQQSVVYFLVCFARSQSIDYSNWKDDLRSRRQRHNTPSPDESITALKTYLFNVLIDILTHQYKNAFSCSFSISHTFFLLFPKRKDNA